MFEFTGLLFLLKTFPFFYHLKRKLSGELERFVCLIVFGSFVEYNKTMNYLYSFNLLGFLA